MAIGSAASALIQIGATVNDFACQMLRKPIAPSLQMFGLNRGWRRIEGQWLALRGPGRKPQQRQTRGREVDQPAWMI
ncbi:MAG: hypothetical protein AAGE13_12090, partial [Pseudomonadota bacterium]